MERLKKLAGILNEVEVKSGIKATDLQFILRDLANAYGEQIADDQIKDDFKNYTVGQIKDDWIKLKGIKEDATSAPAPVTKRQTADVAALMKMIQSNSSLVNKMKNVNNGVEVTDFLEFILNSINDKVTGVQKQKLKSIIDQRFK